MAKAPVTATIFNMMAPSVVMLNQPKAVIYVPVDIFETSTFAMRQMRQGILGEAVSWQNSELSACHRHIFLLVIAQLTQGN
jgi:hypothetical protein